jgi:hypothetical protein
MMVRFSGVFQHVIPGVNKFTAGDIIYNFAACRFTLSTDGLPGCTRKARMKKGG